MARSKTPRKYRCCLRLGSRQPEYLRYFTMFFASGGRNHGICQRHKNTVNYRVLALGTGKRNIENQISKIDLRAASPLFTHVVRTFDSQQSVHSEANPPTLQGASALLFDWWCWLRSSNLWLHISNLHGLCHAQLSPNPGALSPKVTSCAKVTPPLTSSRALKAASHFLHFEVFGRSFGAKGTLTFRSAKCQPHQVSQSASFKFQDAFRARCDVLPFLPTETAQRWSGPGGFAVVDFASLFFSALPAWKSVTVARSKSPGTGVFGFCTPNACALKEFAGQGAASIGVAGQKVLPSPSRW